MSANPSLGALERTGTPAGVRTGAVWSIVNVARRGLALPDAKQFVLISLWPQVLQHACHGCDSFVNPVESLVKATQHLQRSGRSNGPLIAVTAVQW
jgi:hypothetical protein